MEKQELNYRVVAPHLRRNEQYQSWLNRTRQTVARAKDRPARYAPSKQILSGEIKSKDLLSAVMRNKMDEVSSHLDDGAFEQNATDSDGNTALLLAAKNGNLDIVEMLLQRGFSLNQSNFKKRTALLYAAKGGHCSLVERLLSTAECDVDAQDIEGNTALLIAVKRGHNDVIESLLASGQGDVSKQDRYGHTALHDAAKTGRMDTLAMLVFHGANKDVQDKYDNTSLMYATLHDHTNCVALLVKAECNVNLTNMGGRSALHTAAQNGFTNIVSILLQANAKMDIKDSDNNTPILLAGRYQHYAIVKMLIEKGCDVLASDSFGKNTFHFVSSHGYTDLVDLLLRPHYAIDPDKPDKNGNTALIFAVRHNHIDIVRALLRKNCDVTRLCKIAKTEFQMFEYALQNGFVRLLRPLAEAGADVSYYHYWICETTPSNAILEDNDTLEWLWNVASTPKSLQRICREITRQMLSFRIESELESLGLPQKIKDYILMTDNETIW